MKEYFVAFKEILAETLWPTRCVICDNPNTLLCNRCWQSLAFIDHYRACPQCGAPNGRSICCDCNPVSLAEKGLETLPVDVLVSACQSNEQFIKLITTYKDRGEQRLAKIIALLLMPLINPAWPRDLVITTIPARKQALKNRGFDHMKLVAQEVSARTSIPFVPLLGQNNVRDQRNLTAQERIANKQDSFFVLRSVPSSVLVLDDVCTTGATLYAAAHALKQAGCTWVGGATLLRV